MYFIVFRKSKVQKRLLIPGYPLDLTECFNSELICWPYKVIFWAYQVLLEQFWTFKYCLEFLFYVSNKNLRCRMGSLRFCQLNLLLCILKVFDAFILIIVRKISPSPNLKFCKFVKFDLRELIPLWRITYKIIKKT